MPTPWTDYPTESFVLLDVVNVIPKDDMASMEHPVFSLSTKPDKRRLRYEHNGNTLEVIPSSLGLATIHDKDILIYVISQLIAKMKEGAEPKRTVIFRAYDFLVVTGGDTGGDGYRRLKAGLDRLAGTRIKTNIRTNNTRITKNFGIIDSYEIVEKSPVDNRMVAIEIVLSDWLYNAIISHEVLTLSRDYFRLRKPLERRIYELARKHCGGSKTWTVRLETLKAKIGTTADLKKVRFNMRKLVATNHLPDYKVSLTDDTLTFTGRKKPMKSSNTPLPLLDPETFVKAKKAAPGFDIYALEREWREWLESREKPSNPDAAFIAFCRKKHQAG